jgi:uncharacterized membrane-anchored protein YhcB (DUF1043 family)
MVLHFWLIPALAILVAGIGVLYLAVRLTGGSGVRTDGRTVVDKPVDDENRSS